MTSDIASFLSSFNTKSDKSGISAPIRDLPESTKAIKIMEDICNKKILLPPTNSAQVEIAARFSYLFTRYEHFKHTFPFPLYLTRRIISTYNDAFFFGMIKESDVEKEALKMENDRLKRENMKFRGQLGIREETEIPSDTLSSNAEDNE